MVRNASVIARKFVMSTKFQGLPKPSDLTIVEETLPALGKGGEGTIDNLLINDKLSL